ncbi:GDP-mannose 4,6-dehydratase [Mucilaginibacter sp. UYCu711]|uniref:GDP-mannose 4,6-dehydratase n=1 Tax=Mucilaginibacter sp. UYCu711 TaxID=3156339 RepID=UPI003D24D96C
MKALIFGSNGQDGKFLSNLLQKQKIEVIGVSRSNATVIGNVADNEFVSSIVKLHKPEYIFHFAANSTTRHAALFENHEAISTGTINVLEAAKLYSPQSKIFLSGSAMQFENKSLPIDEKTPFEASSAYSVSRIHSVYAGRYYRSTFGLPVYVGYFFNHDSQLRSVAHVNQKIAHAVNQVALGKSEKLELGNIDVKKEFNYAGDVVDAVWKLVNQNDIFEAVIGSGEAFSIKQWAKYCFEKINKDYQKYVTISANFTPEYSTLVSNPALIKSIGWEPKVNFYQLADIMMENL